jgi:hypothetical protein
VSAVIRDCDLCERPFPAEEHWQNKCLICWKEEKEYKLNKADQAFIAMQAAYVDLQAELVAAKKAAKKKPVSNPSPEGMSQKRIHALIKLCHPDRHGGSEAATEMTKWLLSQRRKK